MSRKICSILLILLMLIMPQSAFGFTKEESLTVNGDSEEIVFFDSSCGGVNNDNDFVFSICPDAIRWREVSINQEIIGMNSIDGASFVLNLFDDIYYNAFVDKTQEYGNSNMLRAKINDFESSYLFLSTTDDISLGIIEIPEKDLSYKIVGCSDTNIHYLVEMRLSDLSRLELELSEPLIPPDPSPEEVQEQIRIKNEVLSNAVGTNAHVTVDVMIVYTTAAKNWANNNGGIDNIIAITVGKAQLALDNSETYMSIALVHSAEVDYVESGNSVNDLERLTGISNGYMDEVHDWRNKYGADLVTLFTYDGTGAGVAWLLKSTSGQPTYAFSITRIKHAASSYTYAHEIGHNMGVDHHKQDSSPGPGLFSYSAGWRWYANNKQYRSVMSYYPGVHVPYYSNPNVLYQGQPTGHPTDGDNARTLREIKHVIASYRPSGTINNPPNKPIPPMGNDNVTVGLGYSYNTSAIDPDGDKVQYRFDWGDGTMSSWTSLVNSGQSESMPKSWGSAGTYYVKVQARDEHGAKSGWSDTLKVTITIGPLDLSIYIKSFSIRRISVRVTNNVDATLYDLDYEINIIGNIPRNIDIKNTGTISSLESSSRVSLSTDRISGLGFVDITVFIREEDKTYFKQGKGVVIGPFIIHIAVK